MYYDRCARCYYLVDDQHLEKHALLIQPWVKSKCYTYPAVGSFTVVEEHRRDLSSRAYVLSGVTSVLCPECMLMMIHFL
jgi:hypothetical protein